MATSSTGTENEQESVGFRYLQRDLPDEVLKDIFSYLFEIDLCHAAQVCKRFARVTDNQTLWRNLYRNVYEYDCPVRILQRLEFIEPHADTNEWRESFISMYHADHVRPGYYDEYMTHPMRFIGRSIHWFETVPAAVESCKQHVQRCRKPLVLVHTGTHHLENMIKLDFPLQLVGAASGWIIAERVNIETTNEYSGFDLTNCNGYFGYLTLSIFRTKPYQRAGMQINKDSSPIIDSCTILGGSLTAFRIYGKGANPLIIHCRITNAAISIRYSEAVFEDNKITYDDDERDFNYDIQAYDCPQLTFRGNDIFGARLWMTRCQCEFEDNHIKLSEGAGLRLYESVANVHRCNIHNNGSYGIFVEKCEAKLFNNEIHNNKDFGVVLTIPMAIRRFV